LTRLKVTARPGLQTAAFSTGSWRLCPARAGLSEQGARKRQRADFDPVQAQRVLRAVAQQMARALPVCAEHESALMRPRIAEGACP